MTNETIRLEDSHPTILTHFRPFAGASHPHACGATDGRSTPDLKRVSCHACIAAKTAADERSEAHFALMEAARRYGRAVAGLADKEDRIADATGDACGEANEAAGVGEGT